MQVVLDGLRRRLSKMADARILTVGSANKEHSQPQASYRLVAGSMRHRVWRTSSLQDGYAHATVVGICAEEHCQQQATGRCLASGKRTLSAMSDAQSSIFLHYCFF